jgi:hypothetical protein
MSYDMILIFIFRVPAILRINLFVIPLLSHFTYSLDKQNIKERNDEKRAAWQLVITCPPIESWEVTGNVTSHPITRSEIRCIFIKNQSKHHIFLLVMARLVRRLNSVKCLRTQLHLSQMQLSLWYMVSNAVVLL